MKLREILMLLILFCFCGYIFWSGYLVGQDSTRVDAAHHNAGAFVVKSLDNERTVWQWNNSQTNR